jgi:uncharacterized protein YgiM (DUF1202 family)
MIARVVFLLTIGVAGLAATVQAEDVAYVSSKQTNMYKEANLNSGLMTVLKQNDQVLVLDQRGVWWQIQYTELSGWLSRYSVSTAKPPEEKISIFGRLKNFFSSDSKRSRVTLVSTAGSARGLTEAESDAIGRTNFKAVAQMESFGVDDDQVDTFVASEAH